MAYGNTYGKRPLWQWILLYIVVGAIVYGIIYFVASAGNGGYSGTGKNTGTSDGMGNVQNAGPKGY